MKLNVGCGRTPMEGFLNMDLHPEVPGVIFGDLMNKLPLDPATVDFAYASHVLEHVADFDRAMREMARVVKPGGRFYIVVPYGLKALYNPWHLRPFDETTLWRYVNEYTSCAQKLAKPQWTLESQARMRPYPYAWHIKKYLPTLAKALASVHLTGGDELHVMLRREEDGEARR